MTPELMKGMIALMVIAMIVFSFFAILHRNACKEDLKKKEAQRIKDLNSLKFRDEIYIKRGKAVYAAKFNKGDRFTMNISYYVGEKKLTETIDNVYFIRKI